MIALRKSAERGHFDHGWLHTYHTFSFADYYDPAHRQFRALRVMNEDRIAPGQGFGMHGHRDMEIVTLVLAGELAHRDSLGHTEVLRPGELQRMTAGTGIEHSEFNPSQTEACHLYQIWLLPEARGLPPSYEQKAFSPAERQGRWQRVAARGGTGGALDIRQDAEISLAELAAGESLAYRLRAGRGAWLQILRGAAVLDGQAMSAGDGAAVTEVAELTLTAREPTLAMLFDLA